MIFRYAFFTYMVMLLFSNGVAAQDAHYWTNQHGTRSQLLGGTVVGSLKDMSSSYYNPAAVVLSPDSSLLLAADALDITTIRFEQALGREQDFKTESIRTPPNMVVLRPISQPRHQLLISILTRHQFNLGSTGELIEKRDPIADAPDEQYFAGEVLQQIKLTDTWLGLTWSYALNEWLSVGVSQYLTERSHKRREQAMFQLGNRDGGEALLFTDRFSYLHYSLLWKVGVIARFDPLILGLTLTTPSVQLYGRGSSLFHQGVILVNDPAPGASLFDLSAHTQRDTPAHYKYPLSIAFGASYAFGNTVVHTTAEWFQKIAPFTVMDTEDFFSQTNDEVFSQRLTHEADQVFNVGLGLQHTFYDVVALYGSVITDQSAIRPDTETPLAVASWDILHLSFGSVISLRRTEWALGFGYSFGEDDFLPLLRFPDESQDFFPFPLGPQRVTFQRIRIQVGISVGL